MSNASTGVPASPVSADILSLPEPKALMGMTLRDYFAAKAMQSFASTEYARRLDCEHWAEHAYMLADAMLRERAK